MRRLAVAAFVGAVTTLAWTTRNAVRIEDVPVSLPSLEPKSGRDDESRRDAYPLPRVLAAIDKDPFRPDRHRPASRFRLPGGEAPAMLAAEPRVQVIGTAVAPDGGFAMCSWAGAAARIVRVGERIGDWTLSRVTPGAAEFTGAQGATIVVRIAKAGT